MAAAAGATGGGTEKEPVNIVHRNAIFCETIRKEQRNQRLYTSYGVNPHTKSERPSHAHAHSAPPQLFSIPVHVIAGKPNSSYDSADGAEDSEFLETYRKAQGSPQSKYTFPQTEAQEIGWDTKPLV